MMPWEDVTVQLIDTPPITADYMDSHLHGLIRAADLALLMVDLESDDGHRAVPGRARSARADEDPAGGDDRTSTRRTSGLSYTQTFLVPNKIDLPDAAGAAGLAARAAAAGLPRVRHLGAGTARAWRRCATAIYRAMDVVRVYSKLPAAKEPDRDRPFTLRRGSTLLEMAGMVHKDFLEGLKFARVWGSAVHDGTQVKGDYVLHDKDVVELHM